VRFANGELSELSLNLSPIDSTNNTTSLEALELLTAFEASPNPFLGLTTIQYKLEQPLKNAQFILTDISGKLIQQYSLSTANGILTLDVALEKGLYFGQIITPKGSSRILKLVRL